MWNAKIDRLKRTPKRVHELQFETANRNVRVYGLTC
jgi:hypothetical protein